MAPAPSPQVLPSIAPDWGGFYAGLTGMKAAGSYDGTFSFTGNSFPGDGKGDLDGHGFGLLLGWNGQRGNMVYGAELSYQKTDITGIEPCPNSSWDCGADIDNLASLRGRIGWLAGGNTLFYGTAGVAGAKMMGYTVSSGGTVYPDKHTLNGYVVGLGLERKVSDRVNLRAALMHYDFAGKDYTVDTPFIVQDLQADVTTLELGVIFKF
ncbi:MAG: hypothetical protein CSA68_09635 [Rhodobacterales bacterium]|nr:MAG: hypothetical protein CSA68_09635 [Rhodobacterales bacterium]